MTLNELLKILNSTVVPAKQSNKVTDKYVQGIFVVEPKKIDGKEGTKFRFEDYVTARTFIGAYAAGWRYNTTNPLQGEWNNFRNQVLRYINSVTPQKGSANDVQNAEIKFRFELRKINAELEVDKSNKVVVIKLENGKGYSSHKRIYKMPQDYSACRRQSDDRDAADAYDLYKKYEKWFKGYKLELWRELD